MIPYPTHIVDALEKIFGTRTLISIDIHMGYNTVPTAIVEMRLSDRQLNQLVTVLLQAKWIPVEETTNGSTNDLPNRSDDRRWDS